MHLPAQSREFCWRNWVPIPAFRRIRHRQHHHVRRIFNRRLAEQEAPCYGENCRVQSDSQSQRENYGGRKSRILAHRTPHGDVTRNEGNGEQYGCRRTETQRITWAYIKATPRATSSL